MPSSTSTQLEVHLKTMMTSLAKDNSKLVGGALFLSLAYAAIRHFSASARTQLPPGPKPSFLVGNLPDMPKTKPWEVFQEWSQKYGDVMHLTVFKYNLIILTSHEAISDLLEDRSSVYSDRPYTTMMNELMNLSGLTVNLPYGPSLREHRKIFNKHLNLFAVRKLESHQSEGCKGLLVRLLETPESFEKHIDLCIAQIVMGIAYDSTVTSGNDELVVVNQKNALAFSMASQPGYFLVDMFPFLKHIPDWFPGAQFKEFGRKTDADFTFTREIPFNDVRARMVSGVARPCLVANVLSQMDEKGEMTAEDILTLKEVAVTLYGAATATTVTTLKAFIIAMILHPSVQSKAQRELDSVLTCPRLPELADESSLPYITALVKEVLRWFPATPAGIPHVTSADDVYKGYFIPKGSIIIPNAWSVLRDPSIYEKPFEFRPERFIAQENNGVIEKDPSLMGAFGYGRRICPGRFLAEKMLWLIIASTLTVFKLDYAVNEETGKPIDILTAFDVPEGLLCHPKPFQCSIKPRSEQHRRLIHSISI